MKTIVAIYTGQGLSGPLQALYKEQLPDYRFINIIDDSIISDVNRDGIVGKPVVRRLMQYYHIAEEMGADIILNTCSSVGEVVELARPMIEKPIVRIDEPMAREAALHYGRIGVIATLPSTLDPTMRLIESEAKKLNKKVVLVNGLAEGAYQALVNGKPEEHDQLIIKAAERIAPQVDCIVLAQGSMMRMEVQLTEITGKAVLSSPRFSAEFIKSMG
jgi:Asp/Glu/hydantoin racemase